MKLSTRQTRAMIEKIEATIRSHERKPGTPRNVAALGHAEERLQRYRAHLEACEARDRIADQHLSDRIAGAGGPQRVSRKAKTPADDRRAKNELLAKIEGAKAQTYGDRRPEGLQTEPDADLACTLRELLTRYTSGCIIELTWETSAQMFRERQAAAKEATA
jgi:hypothetical protein